MTLTSAYFFCSFENLVCMYSLKIRKKMDSLPAWWTLFWPPGFSQTNIFLLGLKCNRLTHVLLSIVLLVDLVEFCLFSQSIKSILKSKDKDLPRDSVKTMKVLIYHFAV